VGGVYMLFKKKQIVIIAMVLVVCAAVYLNWQFNNTGEDIIDTSLLEETEGKVLGEAQLVSSGDDKATEVASGTSDYFTEARLTRQKTRDESLELLREIADNKDYDEEVRRKAANHIGAIAANVEKEGKIENLIIGKGFENALAVISGDSVSVMVKSKSKELLSNEIAQIKEIVVNETGFKGDKIKIVPIN